MYGSTAERKEESEVSASQSEEMRSILSRYIRQTEFKRLLFQFQSKQQKRAFKSIAVMSMFPREGKTFFVSALALAYAELLNKRVLIVDTVQQTSNKALYLEAVLGSVLKEIPESKERATPGSIELLTSYNMEGEGEDTSDFQVHSYIRSLKRRYDIILLDTCSVQGAGVGNMDPLILSKLADAAVLVTSDISVKKDSITQLRNELRSFEIDLIGTIYNNGRS